MKSATRAVESPSSFGASRATCSISSRTLTAPALDLDVVEDLAHDAPEQALEAGIVHVGQRADGLFLVRLQQIAAPLVGFELRDRSRQGLGVGRSRCTAPRRAEQGAQVLVGV